MFTTEQFMQLGFEEKKQVMDFMAKFHTKKAKATADMERIPKNGFNDHHNYAFARESDVKDKIRPILNENKLSFAIDLLEHTESANGKWITTNVKMLFKITDTETGYFETFIHDGKALDSGDKGIYKAYSNTIKYGLMDYFLIPTGDDVEKHSHENAQNGQQGDKKQNQGKDKPQGNKAPQGGQQGDKPTWKIIMDAEDELSAVSGKDKAAVRVMMKEKFGEIGKYKDLPEERAQEILTALNGFIAYFKTPQ